MHPQTHMVLITSVSRGGLDDGVSRLQEPVFLSVLHHPQTDPVLDAAASVEELTLGHYRCTTDTY